jgi:hypothetical protein
MMTKVSNRREHDWVSVVAKFDNGAEAKEKWNRGGSDVTVTPRDPVQANRLSLIVDRASKLPDVNVGEIANVIERVAYGVSTVRDLVDGVSASLGVSGELEVAPGAPDHTKVSVKASRGFVVEGIFQSGERFELKINKSSVGLRSQPTVSARDNDLMNLVFGVKNAGLMTDADLAERLKEAAETSPGMDQWIEKARDLLRPAPRP